MRALFRSVIYSNENFKMQRLPITIRTCLRGREILNAQTDEQIKIRGTLPTDVKTGNKWQ